MAQPKVNQPVLVVSSPRQYKIEPAVAMFAGPGPAKKAEPSQNAREIRNKRRAERRRKANEKLDKDVAALVQKEETEPKKEVLRGGQWASHAGAKLTTEFGKDEEGEDALLGKIEVPVDFGDPKWEEKLTKTYLACLQKTLNEHNKGPEWTHAEKLTWVAQRIHEVKTHYQNLSTAEAAAAAAASQTDGGGRALDAT